MLDVEIQNFIRAEIAKTQLSHARVENDLRNDILWLEKRCAEIEASAKAALAQAKAALKNIDKLSLRAKSQVFSDETCDRYDY